MVPGQTIELAVFEATSSNCVGLPLYRFWVDGDVNGLSGDPADTLLRGWTTDPTILDAPLTTTDYLVEFGCSADLSCTATTAVTHLVACPISATNLFPRVTAPKEKGTDVAPFSPRPL